MPGYGGQTTLDTNYRKVHTSLESNFRHDIQHYHVYIHTSRCIYSAEITILTTAGTIHTCMSRTIVIEYRLLLAFAVIVLAVSSTARCDRCQKVTSFRGKQ